MPRIFEPISYRRRACDWLRKAGDCQPVSGSAKVRYANPHARSRGGCRLIDLVKPHASTKLIQLGRGQYGEY